MKKGWEIKRIGDVGEIFNGGTPDTKVAKYWGGNILWITPKDMGQLESVYVDDTSRKITEEGLKNWTGGRTAISLRTFIPNKTIIATKPNTRQ